MNKIDSTISDKAAKVKLLLMDVDGVLTNGSLFYVLGPDNNPVEFKGFNSQDGLGIHCLHFCGIKTGVISGRDSIATTERARILNMAYVFQGFLEKEEIYSSILEKENLTADQVGFIGDDFTDGPLIRKSGFGCCVANARDELKNIADYTASLPGGEGAVREICEIILKSQNLYGRVLEKYNLIT